MRAKDLQVFSTALQFCRTFSETTPEAVIYGYARLLLMDELQIKNLITDENMRDLDTAHRWFSNSKLDLKLIRSGLLLLDPLIIRDDARIKHLDAFQTFLDQDKEVSSAEVLDRALAESFIDFKGKFAEGNDMGGIFAYQTEMKERSAAYSEKMLPLIRLTAVVQRKRQPQLLNIRRKIINRQRRLKVRI